MNTEMTITDEILAAYAEGKTSGSERDAIRKYLADNPSELQSVAMMMDEDFDMDLDMNKSIGKLKCAPNNVSFCAKELPATAVKQSEKMLKAMIASTNIISQKKQKRFDSLLNDLLDEVK